MKTLIFKTSYIGCPTTLRMSAFVILSPFSKRPETTLGQAGSEKKVIVILSHALGGTKDLEILRLTPQNFSRKPKWIKKTKNISHDQP